MTTTVTAGEARQVYGTWALHGAIAGIIGGVVFAMFEMIMAAIQMGAEAFFMPLRMIGGILLGPQAMDPAATSLLVAGAAGLLVHMPLSIAYGVGIALVAAVVPQLRTSVPALIAWASAAGFALWIVNFFVIAPIAGWNWFPQDTDPIVQFVAHTFFFGTVVGLYLEFAARRRRA
jgi:hypothetical protein